MTLEQRKMVLQHLETMADASSRCELDAYREGKPERAVRHRQNCEAMRAAIVVLTEKA